MRLLPINPGLKQQAYPEAQKEFKLSIFASIQPCLEGLRYHNTLITYNITPARSSALPTDPEARIALHNRKHQGLPT